uniref:HupE / UreJ protein n=1 Tax=uncultured Thiotrichaceae bacterium TaxID=298394 RepID=A0A6S6S334_9GAMM|nr:MAG: Unknown protein [uncultured Thiotrichaceae bacterium]
MFDFFMKGVVHPLVTPEHLIVLVALGLLVGQQGWKHARVTLPVFVVMAFVGVALTLFVILRMEFYMGLLAIALVVGTLVVLRLDLPLLLLLVLTMVGAVVVGLDTDVPRIPGLRGMKVHVLLGGAALSSSLVVLISSVIGLSLRNVLEGIPVRVLGAWITAGAVLVLALKLTNNF